MPADLPAPTPGAKMMYLIRRRVGVSRDELVVHWFAHHMPGVIRAQAQAAARSRPRAWRYLATPFHSEDGSAQPWDGVAQLWWDRPLPGAGPFGDPPRDSFQERAEPYTSWPTVEYVLVDGSEHLSAAPLDSAAPYPTTRSGFLKVICLVAAHEGTDHRTVFREWLTTHAGRVASALQDCGGFRYVLSLSLDPLTAPYAGMVELYFHRPDGWNRWNDVLPPEAIGPWVDTERSATLTADTELVGIP